MLFWGARDEELLHIQHAAQTQLSCWFTPRSPIITGPQACPASTDKHRKITFSVQCVIYVRRVSLWKECVCVFSYTLRSLASHVCAAKNIERSACLPGKFNTSRTLSRAGMDGKYQRFSAERSEVTLSPRYLSRTRCQREERGGGERGGGGGSKRERDFFLRRGKY